MNQQSRGLHVQVRALYRSLLESQSHFDEFKAMLARYPERIGQSEEPEAAVRVRAELNARIATWIGGGFDGLTVGQLLQWRAIVLADYEENAEREAHDLRDGRGVRVIERHAG